ncbi:MAG: glucosidase [Methanotrichaceae archaeon]|nr:glucosidase [Methanotrichaceae archaeon]
MEIEQKRLEEAHHNVVAWKKWGPYLSERQWGTVREDYSADGNAWEYFSHDQARSRAYHWGEDGLAGISDDHQLLCFCLALWNGKDPILKERMFGLTNGEGNHSEDVKEYYYYLDSTPTHSYMKYLYKYPQGEYPYNDLVKANYERSRNEAEYELIDTGIFDEDRYFDVFVEYAKAAPEDMLIKVSIYNRGPEEAILHVLPTLWFRNTWSWSEGGSKPALRVLQETNDWAILAHHTGSELTETLPDYYLYGQGHVPLLFAENETNNVRLFAGQNAGPFVKDGISDFVVQGQTDAINPEGMGTKASAHYQLTIGAGKAETVYLRLSRASPAELADPFKDFEPTLKARRKEADDFYRSVIPSSVSPEETKVMRQALAGMLWSKQYYYFDVGKWLEEHGADPWASHPKQVRNREWFHMQNEHIISMPDKWEYPWYAAWDLAFHAVALSIVDPDFAKQQLNLMLKEIYLHPSGQIPAYEWNFSDVNPPVHAWASIFLYRTEQTLRGVGDIADLKRIFGKLMVNFTWWVNRKDRFGKNVFEGGFLGLDNIGVFDRSAQLPTGGYLEQADGTAWMAFFSQNMLEIGIELAASDPIYEDLSAKFASHFLFIGAAMNRLGSDGMWDEEDGFYYDVLRLPDGNATRLKVRSMVGLLPLCATTVIEPWQRERTPLLEKRIMERLQKMPELLTSIHATGSQHLGVGGRGILALVNEERLRRILSRMLDENEFLSPYGIRSLSKVHQNHPYIFYVGGQEYRVDYLPAESNSGTFGGNSNWRGPVWFPINVLIYRALLQYYLYYGDNFKVECPTGSGRLMNLYEVSQEIARRLIRIFLPDEENARRRPVFGSSKKFQADPHWRDYILFYEYFHGDNGAGLGASHQTGWTGVVAKLIQLNGLLDSKRALEVGKMAGFETGSKEMG